MNDTPSRAKTIFQRYESSARWHGDRDLKPRQTEVRRAATTLRKNLEEFKDLMSPEAGEAIRQAVRSFTQLGDDLEVAARMAREHLKNEEARRKAEEMQRNDKLLEEFLQKSNLQQLADDMRAFFTNEGANWVKARRYEFRPYSRTSLNSGESLPEERLRRVIATELGFLSEEWITGNLSWLVHFREFAESRRSVSSMLKAAFNQSLK